MRSLNPEIKKYLYIPSHDMRLVPNDELTLLSPEVPNEEKHIYLDLNLQLVTAFEGEQLVFSQRCSSGAEGTKTPTGEFRTYHKGFSVHMTNQGDALESIYNLPGVPWCTFFTNVGNAFHGAYWHVVMVVRAATGVSTCRQMPQNLFIAGPAPTSRPMRIMSTSRVKAQELLLFSNARYYLAHKEDP